LFLYLFLHPVLDDLLSNWLATAEARALVDAVSNEQHHLPVLFFPDGSTLINPHITTVAAKIGLRTQATHPFYDLIIVGAGPAGLATAVYAASEGLRTLHPM
jgi:thioredoxin reductase (NADPH)